jgi:UDP-N-acetyl-D-glucosamine dehydrogenase
MSLVASRLRDRIETKRARVGVVGLGYVGLPLAVELARSGFAAVGIDLDARKVAAIQRGESYIPDVPTADVARLIASGRLAATGSFHVVAELDTINICVPTPLRKTKDPDMSYIVSAVEAIAEHLHPGMLVILESTTYPGTTEELVLPLLEQSGLKVGVDFFLAFSPERVDPGNPRFNTRNVPKVVGGVTPQCSDLACALYGSAIETIVPVSTPRVAEMVKLLENTFRAVNIGLVNEMALMCDKLGIDVWEVVDAAKTKPFGFMPFYPGPGLGGHCIPIDPFYLSWKAKQTGFEPRFIELAGQVNAAMPHAVVDKIVDALNVHKKPVNGSHVLVIGVSYKRDVDDIRESPSLDVMGLLHHKGARVSYMDPHVPVLSGRAWPGGHDLVSTILDVATLAGVDCVAILTDHGAVDYGSLVASASLVVDTRNAIKQPHPHVFKLGAPPTARARAWAPPGQDEASTSPLAELAAGGGR